MSDTLYRLLVQYGPTVFTWILSALAAAGTWLVVKFIKNKATRAALDEAGAFARMAVADVAQTYVDAIKAGSADGTLTDEEKAHARQLAVEKARSYLSWSTLAKLGGGLFTRVFNPSDWQRKVQDKLGSLVETAVKEDKRADAAAGVPPARATTAPMPAAVVAPAPVVAPIPR